MTDDQTTPKRSGGASSSDFALRERLREEVEWMRAEASDAERMGQGKPNAEWLAFRARVTAMHEAANRLQAILADTAASEGGRPQSRKESDASEDRPRDGQAGPRGHVAKGSGLSEGAAEPRPSTRRGTNQSNPLAEPDPSTGRSEECTCEGPTPYAECDPPPNPDCPVHGDVPTYEANPLGTASPDPDQPEADSGDALTNRSRVERQYQKAVKLLAANEFVHREGAEPAYPISAVSKSVALSALAILREAADQTPAKRSDSAAQPLNKSSSAAKPSGGG